MISIEIFMVSPMLLGPCFLSLGPDLRRRRSIRSSSRLCGQSSRQTGEQVLRALTCILSHERIHNHQRGHSLDDRDSAGHDAGIVTALGLQGTLLEAVGSSILSLANSRRGLEGNAEVDGSTVGDTTLDTAGVVGLGGQALGAVGGGDADEGVVVDGAGNLAAAET